MERTWIERPNCELCGSSNARTLAALPYSDPRIWNFIANYYQGRIPPEIKNGVYAISECTACGFLWQKNILNEELMTALYEEWISSDASLVKREGAGTSYYHKLMRSLGIVRELVGPGRKTVVDFGMGWGHWCCAANAYGLNAIGVETSKSRITFARERGVQTVSSLQEIAPRSIHFINADQVFEHIAEPLEILTSMTRSLVPGGIVHIAVPDGSLTSAFLSKQNWQASKNAWHPLEHINIFTPKTLRYLGERAGLNFLKVLPFRNTMLQKLKIFFPDAVYIKIKKTNLYFQKNQS